MFEKFVSTRGETFKKAKTKTSFFDKFGKHITRHVKQLS